MSGDGPPRSPVAARPPAQVSPDRRVHRRSIDAGRAGRDDQPFCAPPGRSHRTRRRPRRSPRRVAAPGSRAASCRALLSGTAGPGPNRPSRPRLSPFAPFPDCPRQPATPPSSPGPRSPPAGRSWSAPRSPASSAGGAVVVGGAALVVGAAAAGGPARRRRRWGRCLPRRRLHRDHERRGGRRRVDRGRRHRARLRARPDPPDAERRHPTEHRQREHAGGRRRARPAGERDVGGVRHRNGRACFGGRATASTSVPAGERGPSPTASGRGSRPRGRGRRRPRRRPPVR